MSTTEGPKSESRNETEAATRQEEAEAIVWRELHERVEREKVEVAKKLAKESINDHERMLDLMMSRYGVFPDRRTWDIAWAAYQAMEEIYRDKIDRLGELLWQDQRTASLRGFGYSNLTVGIMASVGIAAIGATLVSGFSNFKAAFRELFSRVSELAISPAYAAADSTISSGAFILPVFIYGIYILFAISYVVSLWMMFKGETPKIRSTAVRVFEGLNAFFIGVVSSKVI
jgi:hypothetical protein